MAVSTKHRRTLKHRGRDFVWVAKPDDDSPDTVLHVLSADKRFMAQYVLGQSGDAPVIVILGREFSGAATGGRVARFRCPRFDENAVATPAAVVRLLEWCLTDEGPREPLPLGSYPYSGYGKAPDPVSKRKGRPKGRPE